MCKGPEMEGFRIFQNSSAILKTFYRRGEYCRTAIWRISDLKTVRLMARATLGAAVLQPAFGQYTYSTIVDSATARPDGAGNFFPCCYPAMENQYVVFADNPGTPIEAIWSKNLITGTLTKLVDLNTQ